MSSVTIAGALHLERPVHHSTDYSSQISPQATEWKYRSRLALSDIPLLPKQHTQTTEGSHHGRLPSPPSELSSKNKDQATKQAPPPRPARTDIPKLSRTRKILVSLQDELKLDSTETKFAQDTLKQDDGEETALRSSLSNRSAQFMLLHNKWIEHSPQNRRRRAERVVTRAHVLADLSKKLSATNDTTGRRAAKFRKHFLFSAEELEKIYDQFNEIDVEQVGIIDQTQLGNKIPIYY